MSFPLGQKKSQEFWTKKPQCHTSLKRIRFGMVGTGPSSPRSYGRTFRDSRPGPRGACVSGNPPWKHGSTMESNQESSICQMSPDDFPCLLIGWCRKGHQSKDIIDIITVFTRSGQGVLTTGHSLDHFLRRWTLTLMAEFGKSNRMGHRFQVSIVAARPGVVGLPPRRDPNHTFRQPGAWENTLASESLRDREIEWVVWAKNPFEIKFRDSHRFYTKKKTIEPHPPKNGAMEDVFLRFPNIHLQ